MHDPVEEIPGGETDSVPSEEVDDFIKKGGTSSNEKSEKTLEVKKSAESGGEGEGPGTSDGNTEEIQAKPLDNVEAVLQGKIEHEKLSQECHSVMDDVGKNIFKIQQITEELPVGQGEKEGCITTVGGPLKEGDTKESGLVAFPRDSEVEKGEQKGSDVLDCITDTTKELPVEQVQTQAEEKGHPMGCLEVVFQGEAELDKNDQKVGEFQTQAEEGDCSLGCQEVAIQVQTELEKKEQKVCNEADAIVESDIETVQTMAGLPIMDFQTQKEEGQLTSCQEATFDGETKEEGFSVGCCEPQAEKEDCSVGYQKVTFQVQTELKKKEQKVCNIADAIGESKFEIGQTTTELSVLSFQTKKEEVGQSTSCQEVTLEVKTKEGDSSMDCEEVAHETKELEVCIIVDALGNSKIETEFEGNDQKIYNVMDAIGTTIETRQTREISVSSPNQAEKEGQSTSSQEATFQGETEPKREQRGGGVLISSGETIEVKQTTEELHVEHVQTLPGENCQPTGSQDEHRSEGMSNKQTLNKKLENKNSEEQECPALSTLETTTEAQNPDYVCHKAFPSLEGSLIFDTASRANETQPEVVDCVKAEVTINSVGASDEQPTMEYKDDRLAPTEGNAAIIKDCGNDSVTTSAEQPAKEYIDDKLATLEGAVVTVEDCGNDSITSAEQPAEEYKDDKLATSEGDVTITDCGNDSVAMMHEVTGAELEVNRSAEPNGENNNKETCTEMQDGAAGSSVVERHSSPSEKVEDFIQVVEAQASEQKNEDGGGGGGESGSNHGIDEKERTESESESKNSDELKGEAGTSQPSEDT